MGLEPTTATLATWRSTTELHPHEGRSQSPSSKRNYKGAAFDFKGEKQADAGVSCVGPRSTAPARTTLHVGPTHEWSELHLADLDLLVVSFENNGVTLGLF